MNLNDAALKEYSGEHLFYEVDMLFKVRSYLFNLKEAEWLQRMTAIESFVIHLRNLITFLYPTTNTKDTDIYARAFFTNPSGWSPKIPVILEKARERAHKEVGHLTTERIVGAGDPRKEWPIKELTDEITPILKSFCTSADKAKLDERILKLFS